MTRLIACAGLLALLSCASAAAAPAGGGLAVPNALPASGGAVQGESFAPSPADGRARPAARDPEAATPTQVSPAQSTDPSPVSPEDGSDEPVDGSDEPAGDPDESTVGDEEVRVVVPLPDDAETDEQIATTASATRLPLTGFAPLVLALLGASMLAAGYAARSGAGRRDRRTPRRR